MLAQDGAGAAGRRLDDAMRAAPAAPSAPAAPADPYSNVRAADYVGPDACGACHDDNHDRWSHSLHAAMNRRAGDPTPAGDPALRGDFDGARVAYAGGVAAFDRDGDALTMTLTPARGAPRRFRVTRTIGSRYLQEYVGVAVDGPAAATDGRAATEIRLPFGWWVRRAAWYPQPYFDAWFDAEYDDAGVATFDAFAPDPTPWASRCAWCHNTYPFEIKLARAAAGGAVGHGPQQLVEVVPGAAGAGDGFGAELDPVALGRDNLLPVDRLVTIGISCESCHLGGRAHAVDDEPIRFVPASPALRPRADAPSLAGGRDNPVVIDAICAQCHSTPAPRFPGGGAVRNSTEALDLLASACAPAIKCTDCHDPHTAGPGPGAADAPRHLAACVGCHDALAAPAAARAHAHHPDGTVTCLDCHMPRIVQGVSAFVRTHRVARPVEPAMLAIGGPNACNLCHLDRSLRWTLDALADGWGVRIAPEPAWLPYYAGSADAPVGPAWLGSPVRTYRILAAAAYARSPARRAALPRLVAALDDPVAFARMWILFAIEDALGRRLDVTEYDPLAAPAVRAAQAARLQRRW
ncbi:MAG: ammonia-forming cytochrome c nitrite reductase subunit c552 [Kofleriaceae bacterium]|nr:ammonia-forming cytochrome c nitrite reductase subunit c552 [Kofleriaceae bacterium]